MKSNNTASDKSQQQELYLKELNPFKDKRYGNVTLFVDPNSEMYFTRKEKVFKSKTQLSEVASQINKRVNNPNLYFVAPLTYEYDEIMGKDSTKKMPVLKLFMPFPEENLETELVERIKMKKPFNNKEITYLMYDLLHGFYHLQFLGFSHCKFGPEFVAKTTTGYAILDDPLHYPFDPIDLKKKKDWYLSPEAYKTALMGRKAGKDYSLVKADVFGLGLVILEAAIQMNVDEIYGHPSEKELDLDALNHLIEILKARYPENNLLVSTLKKMLTVSKEQRPDFFEMFDRMPPYEMIKNYFENLPMTQEERQSMRNSIHGSHALEAKDPKVFAKTRPDDTKYMKYSSIKNSRYIENLDNNGHRRGAQLEKTYKPGFEMMIKSEVVEKDIVNEKMMTGGNSNDEDLSMYKRSYDDREKSVISSFSNLKPKISVKIQKNSPKVPLKRPPTPKKKKETLNKSSSNLHKDNLLNNRYLGESEHNNNVSFIKEESQESPQKQQQQQQQQQNMFNLSTLDISALVQQKVKEELEKLTMLREKEDEMRRQREMEEKKLMEEIKRERELMEKQRLEGEKQKELLEHERSLMEKHRQEAEKHRQEAEKQRLEAEKQRLETEKKMKELEDERELMKKQREDGEKQKEDLQKEKEEIAKLKADLIKKQEMLELKSKEVSIQHQYKRRNSSLKKISSRNETEHNSTIKSPESKTMQASPYRSYNMKSIEENRERSISRATSPRREQSKAKLVPFDEDKLDLPDGWAQEGKFAITPSGIKVQKMLEIGYRRTASGREVEYQQVKWRKISKEEEHKNIHEFNQKKKLIQNTLKTPEKKIQPAIFVESRSPTPDNKVPVDFNKNYFSSAQQQQGQHILQERPPMLQKNKWNTRSVQRHETPSKKPLSNIVMNKQQILNGIEGKIKRLTPSKSFNMSVTKGERGNTFQNTSANYNSTNALNMPQFSKGSINQNLIHTQASPKPFHDAYGNFPPRNRAPVSPYRKADRTASKSPQRSPKLVSENIYPLKSHQQSMIFEKENVSHDANIKIIKKPTLQNHFTLKDKERNGIKHHEPSFVEDSNIFTRERRPENVNTRVTKQGVLITRNANTSVNTANVSVNHFDKSPEIYEDYKGGAIIPINNLHDDSEDFVDFDELNTPNIQKHFSLNQQQNPPKQHQRAPELRGQRSQYINYGESRDPAFYKNSKHGGSYHYTFKGRDSSKKGGIESGYNNEWINEEPEGITIYSQNDGYNHGY